MADTIKIRRDIEANWNAVASTCILAEGEIGIITDKEPLQCKVGNGTTNWQNLPIQAWVGPGSITQLSGSIAEIRTNTSYVLCSSASGSAAKEVNLPDFELSTHCRLVVQMAEKNVAASPTLNVNDTGAVPLWFGGALASADNTWDDGDTLDVYYDGTVYNSVTLKEPKFGSGQSIPATKVRNENGVEVSGPADILSAEAGKNLEEASQRIQLVGNGNTIVNTYVKRLIKGQKCRIYIGNNWDMTGVTVVANRLYIANVYNNAETQLVSVGTPSEVAPYYDINIPLNHDYLRISIRAAIDEIVSFSILQQTLDNVIDTNDLKNASVTTAKLAAGSVTKEKVSQDFFDNILSNDSVKGVDIKRSINSILGFHENFIKGVRFQAHASKEYIVVNDSYCIGKDYIPVSNGDSITWVYGSAADDGASMLNIYDSNKNWIAMGSSSRNSNGSKTFTISNANAAYIRASFVIANNENNGLLVNNIWKFRTQEYAETKYANIDDYGKIIGSVVDFSVKNGSQPNPGNAYGVTLRGAKTLAIPAISGHKYRIVISKKPSQGYEFYYNLYTYNTTTPSSLSSNYVRIEQGNGKHSIDDLITIAEGEVGFSIYLVETDEANSTPQSSHNIALRDTDFDYSNISILDVTDSMLEGIIQETANLDVRVTNLENNVPADPTNIVRLNDVELTKRRFTQLKRTVKDGSLSTTRPNLILAHFSDIHGSSNNLSRIMQYCNYWQDVDNGANIDDILFTGDSIANAFNVTSDEDYSAFWHGSGADRVLFCIGNHDTAQNIGGVLTWDTYVGLPAYNRFFKDYISYWGNIVQPSYAETLGLCYYYKDYSTRKVRLIVLDVIGWDSTQLDWFESVLASAITAELQVAVAIHYPAAMTKFDCTFTSLFDFVDNVHLMPNDALNAVDTFITGGGEFIAWITGHQHRDFIGVVSNHANQSIITISTANGGSGQSQFDNVERVANTKSFDLFNIMSIDTYNKRISIFRVGANIDMMLRHIDTICYDYGNKQVVWNN